MILSGSVAVPANGITVDILGGFGVGYTVVGLVPDWLAGGLDATALVPSQFTATWDQPAPAGGGTLQWTVNTGAPSPVGTGCVVAGTLLTRMRAKIPDNVYVAGVPQPDADGKFRASDCYAWMDDAAKVLTQLTGWTIDDWYAVPQVAKQPWYALDPKFISMQQAFANQFPLSVMLNEGWTIWPNTLGPVQQQALGAFVRRLGEVLEVGLFPSPMTADPATTLTANIGASGADPILLASTADFLTYGYVMIDSEIIQYQERPIAPVSIGVISRGVCGTAAAAHAMGATVQHLGFWIKGKRLPVDLTGSQSCVEIPRAWMSHLETYVLAQVREAQQRSRESAQLLAAFEKACRGIDADPNWKVNRGQIAAFGDYGGSGPLYGRSPFGVIVP